MKIFKNPNQVLERTKLVENLLEFVAIDTQSDPRSSTVPSSSNQLELQRVLVKKLEAVGCSNVVLNEQGYLTATFPGKGPNGPVLGLIAHVDTATDFSGSNVRPVLHKNFKGGTLTLPNGLTITPEDSPELKECVGDTLITASGDTLLGADNKAGISEILALLEVLQSDPDIVHPTLRIAFTPDEEIGRGATHFDIQGFGAQSALTVDGGWTGEVNFETFSADMARVTFTGVAVHPGWAKGKMVNALRYLGRFLAELPIAASPETTEGRQGFIHPINVGGNAAEAFAELILRDFDNDKLRAFGNSVRDLAIQVAKEEPRLKVDVVLTEQYRNMAEVLSHHPEVASRLETAVRDAGLKPVVNPVRGGTDGSGLTAKGLPTPNLFTGGCNFHGPREWISTRVMGLAVCSLLNLVQRWAGEE